MPTLEEIKQIQPKMLLKLIQRGKDYLKKNKVMQEICNKYDFDINDIDLIPVRFGDIDVSARTDKGIVTLNWKLLADGDFFKDFMYLLHEFGHYIQQSKEPTQSADDGDYLLNPSEQEAFQYQVKYIDDQFGEDEAADYVEQVLDHHDEDGEERAKKKDILMEKVEFFHNVCLQKFADKVSDLKSQHPNFANEIQLIADEDPTSNKKYLHYAVKQLLNKQAPIGEIIDVIKLFHKFQNKLDVKDINAWNFTDLRDKLFEIRGTKSKREERNEIKTSGAQLVYEDEQCKVLLVKDKAAACFYGSGTKWCITMANESYFEEYQFDNIVFFFILRKDLPKENAYYKVAIAYYRDIDNKVTKHQIFDATDLQQDALSENNDLVNQSNIFQITKSIAEQQPTSRAFLLANFKLKPEEITLEDVADDKTVKHILLYDIEVSSEAIKYIYKREMSKDPDVDKVIKSFDEKLARYPYTPAEILNDIAKNMWKYNYDLAYILLHNNNVDSQTIKTIYDICDGNIQIAYLIAKHPETPEDILQNLFKEWNSSHLMLHSLVVNPNLPASILEQIIENDLFIVAGEQEIINHPNITIPLLQNMKSKTVLKRVIQQIDERIKNRELMNQTMFELHNRY